MKTVLILSGPTHEYMDPVRFIGNASSGKMGKALAQEAVSRGFDVAFISGPVSPTHLPASVPTITHITSTEEMLHAAQSQFSRADIIIFAAAVADFQPRTQTVEKMPKTGQNLTIELQPTPDIAATLCATKRENQVAIGFALQTHDGETRAKKKLAAKNLNGIVLNTPATLGAETGLFTWIDSQGADPWGSLDKEACAKRIFDRIGQGLTL